MARPTQRARIEAVAHFILVAMEYGDYSVSAARAHNEREGWTLTQPSAAGAHGVIQIEGAKLTDWELTQAYLLAANAFASGAESDSDNLVWTDPRKTGRKPIYEEPLSGVLLELPSALIDAIETERGDVTRREWIETAIRQRLERDGVRGDEA